MSDPVSVNTRGDTAVIKIGKLVITVEGDTITVSGKKMKVVGSVKPDAPTLIEKIFKKKRDKVFCPEAAQYSGWCTHCRTKHNEG